MKSCGVFYKYTICKDGIHKGRFISISDCRYRSEQHTINEKNECTKCHNLQTTSRNVHDSEHNSNGFLSFSASHRYPILACNNPALNFHTISLCRSIYPIHNYSEDIASKSISFHIQSLFVELAKHSPYALRHSFGQLKEYKTI